MIPAASSALISAVAENASPQKEKGWYDSSRSSGADFIYNPKMNAENDFVNVCTAQHISQSKAISHMNNSSAELKIAFHAGAQAKLEYCRTCHGSDGF